MSKLKLCLEDLSNDVLMEIFDYLPGQKILCLFLNLNHRFNSLCINYPKFDIDTTDSAFGGRLFRQFRCSIPSKHVRSLKFAAEKSLARISVQYFTSLISLTFNDVMNSTKIKEFLEKLPSPDRLYHLTIYSYEWLMDTDDLVKTIYKLTRLNRLELIFFSSYPIRIKLTQPLLSLRYFSTNCYEYDEILELFPFMPNLISLNFSPVGRTAYSTFPFIQPNSLSKLKIPQMGGIRELREIGYLFRLCPQVNTCKIYWHGILYAFSMIKAKDWEELFKPMKFLKKIEINVCGFYDSAVIDLSEYGTQFWIERNWKAIEYTMYEPRRPSMRLHNGKGFRIE